MSQKGGFSEQPVSCRFTVFYLCLFVCVTRVGASDSQFHTFLSNYCYSCHGTEKPKADLDLSRFALPGAIIQQHPEIWENVLRQVQEHEMPPRNKPQPTDVEREAFTAAVFKRLDADSNVPKNPGTRMLHRLNHQEYRNTIRDLLGIDYEASRKFPTDGGGGGGFDNNASTLFLPPLLLEKYLEAADEILVQFDPKKHEIFKNVSGRKRAQLEKALQAFATRAFRRPVSPDEVARLIAVYDRSISSGADPISSLKHSLKVVLVSPHFLFRIEKDPPGPQPAVVNDYELASRLSYFLWSSMPDDELFRLASRSRLSEPKILQAQLSRMLRDRKARAFSESFVSQWLHVRDLKTSAQPDPKKFPEYSSALREASYREPIELFHYLLQNNGSLLDLLNADYTFLNEDLATIYKLDVKGAHFRRVSLKDPNRGGVLTMPAVLTLTSYPLRTSPVLRGKWILEEILGTPPPPPPPAVASLPPDDSPREGLSLRQRLEKHREDPNCASCHQKMDPLGFSLENFDPIGRWRTEIAGVPIDAAGELSTGELVKGPAEMKKVLLEKKDQFIQNLAEKLLAYALGRGLEYYDRPSVKVITQSVAKSDYKSQALLLEVVRSYPFQYRAAESMELSKNE